MEQQFRSVMLVRLPPELRTSEKLKQFWDYLLPGKVHSAVVPLATRDLAKVSKAREQAALHLERSLLFKDRTGTEPLIIENKKKKHFCSSSSASKNRGNCLNFLGGGASSRRRQQQCREEIQEETLSAIDYYREELATLNAEFREARLQLINARTTPSSSLEETSFFCEATQGGKRSSFSLRDQGRKPYADRFGRLLGLGSPTWLTGESCVAKNDQFQPQTESSSNNLLEEAALGVKQLATKVFGGEEYCDTGFVTFKDYSSAAMVRQMRLSPRPLSVEALGGVQDLRNINWQNISQTYDTNVARSKMGSFLVYVLAFYWSLFITFCYVVGSYDSLETWGMAPKIDSLPPSRRAFVTFLFSVAPVGLVSLGLALLPLLLLLLSEHYEKQKLRSDMQLSVLRRNFFLQMINLWLTVVAGSIWDALKSITKKPTSFFEFVGETLPIVSIYFVQIVIIRTFVSNSWELARIIPWLRLRAAKIASGGALAYRDHRDHVFLQPEMMYGATYTGHLMVLIICLLFAVIAPLVYPFCLLYFAIAYVVYVHQGLHVYVPKNEAGGLFFFPVMTFLLAALCATQLTLVGYLVVLQAYVPAAFVFILPLLTYGSFFKHVRHHYQPACDKAALQLTLARDAECNLPKPGQDRPLADVLADRFDPHLYRQPDLDDADAQPQDPWSAMDDDDDDENIDDLGQDLEKNNNTVLLGLIIHDDEAEKTTEDNDHVSNNSL